MGTRFDYSMSNQEYKKILTNRLNELRDRYNDDADQAHAIRMFMYYMNMERGHTTELHVG